MSAGSAFGEGTRLANFGSANSNRSYERGGDTDNNAADFHLIAPGTPQTLEVGCNSTPAPTNPAVSGAASPATVAAGDNVLLQAAVMPGTSPASTGLSVAASTAAIGVAGTVALVDNGTQG